MFLNAWSSHLQCHETPIIWLKVILRKNIWKDKFCPNFYRLIREYIRYFSSLKSKAFLKSTNDILSDAYFMQWPCHLAGNRFILWPLYTNRVSIIEGLAAVVSLVVPSIWCYKKAFLDLRQISLIRDWSHELIVQLILITWFFVQSVFLL